MRNAGMKKRWEFIKVEQLRRVQDFNGLDRPAEMGTPTKLIEMEAYMKTV